MPTVLTHAVLAGAVVAACPPSLRSGRLAAAAIALSILPDADVIGFSFGVHYGDFLGHRGLTHSACFALVLACLATALLFRDRRPFTGAWWATLLLLFAAGASHGVLDAMTDGGLGIALLSPFESSRYFLPWRPIPVAPIGVSSFLTPRGMHVLFFEVTRLWLPAGAAALLLRRLWRLVPARHNDAAA